MSEEWIRKIAEAIKAKYHDQAVEYRRKQAEEQRALTESQPKQ